jgi:hypothetical protein
MDLGKPLVLVITLFFGVLLIVLLDAQAFKVSPQHVAVLEVMVRGPFVVRTRFFEHFIKNAPVGGSSRLFVVGSSDEVISRGFTLALLVLLVVVVFFGTPIGALEFLVLVLPLVLVATKDGTNRLLVGDIVGMMSTNSLAVVGVLWPNSRTSSLQVVPERKAMMTSELVMLGSSMRCLEKHRI